MKWILEIIHGALVHRFKCSVVKLRGIDDRTENENVFSVDAVPDMHWKHA